MYTRYDLTTYNISFDAVQTPFRDEEEEEEEGAVS
jgi:hypothetical protein